MICNVCALPEGSWRVAVVRYFLSSKKNHKRSKFLSSHLISSHFNVKIACYHYWWHAIAAKMRKVKMLYIFSRTEEVYNCSLPTTTIFGGARILTKTPKGIFNHKIRPRLCIVNCISFVCMGNGYSIRKSFFYICCRNEAAASRVN